MKDHAEHRCLRVGDLYVEFDIAQAWVADYVQGGRARYGYPAYESYRRSQRQDPLDDADLLAPVLLNVSHMTLDAYYWLREQLEDLNLGLRGIEPDATLAGDQADPQKLAPLFGTLDRPDRVDVRMTVLSKVLHRKRPGFIPLWDNNVGRCYAKGPDGQLKRDRSRPYAEFAVVVANAIRMDLVACDVEWKELAALANEPSITELRALDIVAWNLGNSPRSRCDPSCHG